MSDDDNNNKNMYSDDRKLIGLLVIVMLGIIAMGLFTSPTVSAFLTSKTEADGSLSVSKQDQTTQLLELVATQLIAEINLTENLTLGQTVINITSNIAPVVGNVLCIKDADGNVFTQDKIQNVVSLGGNLYQVTIESGVEYPFSIEDGCSIRNSNMAIDGSITPQFFTVSPLNLDPNVEWDLTRVICVGSGNGVGPSNDKPDLGDFWTTGSDNTGMLFRFTNTVFYKNLFYAKTNADFVKHMYDVQLTDASKQGLYSVSWRKTINGDDKSGVVARLNANSSSSEYHTAEIIIDRDLTDLTSLECIWMGHETDSFSESQVNTN